MEAENKTMSLNIPLTATIYSGRLREKLEEILMEISSFSSKGKMGTYKIRLTIGYYGGNIEIEGEDVTEWTRPERIREIMMQHEKSEIVDMIFDLVNYRPLR